MKNLILLALIAMAVLFLTACNKPDNNAQSAYKVMEDNTNNPVAGVTVDAYKCTSKDWLGNCNTIGSYLASTTTDNEGKALFASSLGTGTLRTKKDKYWDHENPNPGYSPEFYITPISTLKVILTRVNAYPAGYVLNIVSQPQGCNDCIWETKQLLQPADNTVVYLKGGGNYHNSVGWYVGSPASGSSSPAVLVNRFDTATFNIQY